MICSTPPLYLGPPIFFLNESRNNCEIQREKYCKINEARPDTRPPVADGWAAAETLFTLFDMCSPMDRPTDGRMDKASYRVACPQLKMAKQRKKAREQERKKERQTKKKIHKERKKERKSKK